MATTPNRSWPTPDDSDLVRDGAAAIRALGDAIDGSVGQGFVYAGTRYYTSSGQFEKDDPLGTGDIGLRAIRVRCQGAGGGGGGATATSAGQYSTGFYGDGGGYAESFITDIAGLDASVTVTRGAGGPGGVGGGAGSNGAASSFGSLVIGDGGPGGTVIGPSGVPSGLSKNQDPVGGTGDLVIFSTTVPGYIVTTVERVGQFTGGHSFLGSGGRSISQAGGQGGFDGTGFGGGGSPGVNTQNQSSSRPGGNGANGIVIVDCFV